MFYVSSVKLCLTQELNLLYISKRKKILNQTRTQNGNIKSSVHVEPVQSETFDQGMTNMGKMNEENKDNDLHCLSTAGDINSPES